MLSLCNEFNLKILLTSPQLSKSVFFFFKLVSLYSCPETSSQGVPGQISMHTHHAE